jgi:hypothetical protein
MNDDTRLWVRIAQDDFENILSELRNLRAQRDELQQRGTEMALERQRWRDSERITVESRKAAALCMTEYLDLTGDCSMSAFHDAFELRVREHISAAIRAVVESK